MSQAGGRASRLMFMSHRRDNAGGERKERRYSDDPFVVHVLDPSPEECADEDDDAYGKEPNEKATGLVGGKIAFIAAHAYANGYASDYEDNPFHGGLKKTASAFTGRCGCDLDPWLGLNQRLRFIRAGL